MALRGVASTAFGCCGAATCSACKGAGAGATAVSTRLAFTLLFIVTQVIAWMLRDYAKPLIQKLPWYSAVKADSLGDAWFGQQAVLRCGVGSATFFGVLALALLGVQSGVDVRVRCALAPNLVGAF